MRWRQIKGLEGLSTFVLRSSNHSGRGIQGLLPASTPTVSPRCILVSFFWAYDAKSCKDDLSIWSLVKGVIQLECRGKEGASERGQSVRKEEGGKRQWRENL